VAAPDDRKTIEQRFHDDRYAGETRAGLDKYYEVMRASLGAFRELARSAALGADVLEYGCGAEPHAFEVAREAKSVRGIDISPVAIARARERAETEGLPFEFAVMDAESLEFPDDSFDLVYGSAVVHHLDVRRALHEVARVLRPSGRAVFIEPLGHNPLINLYRRLTPELRTPDEHPLRLEELELARSFFETSDFRFYHFLSLAAVPFRSTRAFAPLLRRLDGADQALFNVTPLRRLAWYVVMVLDRPGAKR
jgi:ubiquinone/menaquinone biosynthesis C-methylase UbiE